MDWSSVATHAVTFLLGIATGAGGQYFADRFTRLGAGMPGTNLGTTAAAA